MRSSMMSHHNVVLTNGHVHVKKLYCLCEMNVSRSLLHIHVHTLVRSCLCENIYKYIAFNMFYEMCANYSCYVLIYVLHFYFLVMWCGVVCRFWFSTLPIFCCCWELRQTSSKQVLFYECCLLYVSNYLYMFRSVGLCVCAGNLFIGAW